MAEWTFRIAEPTDAEAFAKWVIDNPHIDPKDVQDGLYKNNPSALTFVVCRDGVPVVFAPVYPVMQIAHLGFNPESGADDRKEALGMILEGAGLFALQCGVRAMSTLTKSRYPIAQWAKDHGFEPDKREWFKLDLNKWLKEK